MACDDRNRHRTLVILAIGVFVSTLFPKSGTGSLTSALRSRIRRSVEHPLHGSGLSDKRSLRMAVGTVLFRRPVGESRFGQ